MANDAFPVYERHERWVVAPATVEGVGALYAQVRRRGWEWEIVEWRMPREALLALAAAYEEVQDRAAMSVAFGGYERLTLFGIPITVGTEPMPAGVVYAMLESRVDRAGTLAPAGAQ